MESLLKENVNVKASQKSRINKAESLSSLKQTQLIGALRRIKYLVQEERRTKAEHMAQEQYIARLETKLLELNTKLKKSKSKSNEVKGKGSTRASSPFCLNISQLDAMDSISEDLLIEEKDE